MDIYKRLQSQKPQNRIALLESLSRCGDADEILSYINNMAVICPEGKGFLNVSPEVRLDERFLVLCCGKKIEIYYTASIKFFFFSFNFHHPNDKTCRFFFSRNGEFFNWSFLNRKYAKILFQSFNQYITGFDTNTSLLDDKYIHQYQMDAQGLTFYHNLSTFFRPVKEERILFRDILSCSMRYITGTGEGDGADQDCLLIYLRDGSTRKFTMYGSEGCYKLAKTIKHFAPHLQYQLF